MTKSIAALLLGSWGASHEASAQEAATSAGDAACAKCAECPESPIGGELSMTATTHYFFRGLIQEDQGLIFQPALSLSTDLWSGDGPVQSLELSVCSWNSLHSGPTGTGGHGNNSPSAWYESDLLAGLTFNFAGGMTLDASWVEYTIPNGLFKTTSEIDFVVGFDDSEWCARTMGLSGGFGPTVTLGIEVDGQSDQNGAPAGTDEGKFLGFGIAPSFDCCTLGSGEFATPCTMSFPLNAGFSLGDYYEDATGDDDRFGYWDVGVFVSFPIASRFGEWQMSLGTQAVMLNGNQEDLNHGESFEWTGTMALSIGF
ncbi:MAG: hypothetical protein EXR73_00390 [Myxococcales bacterium]|nr:hypothetical protein [Myxococcales bacterium]